MNRSILAVSAALLLGGAVQAQLCYTLESLKGSYGVVVQYGANVALGLQPETLDGAGNLKRTGINNQPVVGSATGARTVTNVTSTGTYTVNCNGTGTINRTVTRADGTTAVTSDDFLVTDSFVRGGQLIATRIVDAQREASVIVPGGVFVTRVHTLRPSIPGACYTLESLKGTYGVEVNYGSSVAMGLQPENLDGAGNLSRTGINNQLVAGTTTGERTVANVTSTGTYTVNCDGTGVINRVVTRPDGTTATTSDDFLVVEAIQTFQGLIATRIIDVQRDPSVVPPGGLFVYRTHRLLTSGGYGFGRR